MNMQATVSTSTSLETDVRRAIDGAENLLNEAATAGAEKATELRRRAMEQLQALRARIEETGTAVAERSKAAARATDSYVHAHPYQAMAAAASVGLLIGMLIARR
jgi:ElaB/YqjD/DUF883 family membrane-anchored ribosome-binding protein